jgi:hypothetical protein
VTEFAYQEQLKQAFQQTNKLSNIKLQMINYNNCRETFVIGKLNNTALEIGVNKNQGDQNVNGLSKLFSIKMRKGTAINRSLHGVLQQGTWRKSNRITKKQKLPN